MSTFLAIDSKDGDDIAAISSYLESVVYPYLQNRGLVMQPFFGPLARPEYVGPAAVNPNVTLLLGGGHGTYDAFLGFQGEPIFAKGSYSSAEVQGKIAHFLSCETAKYLGPDLVQNGCIAYIGYDENFVFDPDLAGTFFGCDGAVVAALADGLTVRQAVEKAKGIFVQNINQLNAEGNVDAAHQLAYNLAHLRSPVDGPQWGNPDAKLT